MNKLNNILNLLESKFKNKYNINEKYDLSSRQLLAKMRKLNEVDDDNDNNETKDLGKNLKTDLDQSEEEKKFREYFNDLQVDIKFAGLDVYERGVFFGGNIDGQIDFVFKVTDNETTSGYDINYTKDFDPNQEDNAEVIKRIELYYNIFYKYWRDNILQDKQFMRNKKLTKAEKIIMIRKIIDDKKRMHDKSINKNELKEFKNLFSKF